MSGWIQFSVTEQFIYQNHQNLWLWLLLESEHNESSSTHVGSAAVQVRLWEARLWCDTLSQQTVPVTQRWDAELYKNPFKCFFWWMKKCFIFLTMCAACFGMRLWHMRSVGSVCKAAVHSVHAETGQNETWCLCLQGCWTIQTSTSRFRITSLWIRKIPGVVPSESCIITVLLLSQLSSENVKINAV